MKKKKSIVLIGLFVLAVWGYASAREPGAGGVLYTTIQGSTYVLLADHRYNNRGWAAFGGRLDGQSPIRAAAREIEEETNGLVDRKWAIEQLSSSPFYMIRDGSWHYTMYFLEVPFKPAVQFTSTKPSIDLEGAKERGPYSWIPLSTVIKAMKQYRLGVELVSVPSEYLPSNRRSSWFWPVFLSSLNQADNDGVFPW
jgi:8-oxo-dGTP pyrophosphatase MutT (NUDIX family)